MKNAQELRQKLAHYTGVNQVYCHSLVESFNYTTGMRAVFQHAGNGAYWLGDIMATEPSIRHAVMKEGFCVALLQVDGNRAVFSVARDYDEHAEDGSKLDSVYFTLAIDLTDFPEGTWKFCLTYTRVGDSNVVLALLSSEY